MEHNKTHYNFSAEKNQQLIEERGISFEEIITAIEEDYVLAIIPNPNTKKYPHQKMYVVNIYSYVYVVPFVKQDDQNVFLKTIFPHRKLTKKFLKGG